MLADKYLLDLLCAAGKALSPEYRNRLRAHGDRGESQRGDLRGEEAGMAGDSWGGEALEAEHRVDPDDRGVSALELPVDDGSGAGDLDGAVDTGVGEGEFNGAVLAVVPGDGVARVGEHARWVVAVGTG